MNGGGTDDMARSADIATPNIALYNLRDALGASQQDVAAALNKLAAAKGKNACVTANQVSRWERGKTHPSPFYRQLLSEHFGVPVDELGLSKPKIQYAAADLSTSSHLDPVTPPLAESGPVHASQEEWRKTRRDLNAHRVELARHIASLYEAELQLAGTGLLVHPDWLPATPIPLSDIRIERDDARAGATIRGTEDFANHVLPLATPRRRFHRYSQAIRTLSHPRLFENRLSWCLQDVAWSSRAGHMSFCDTTYFESVDMFEALAHETAASLVGPDGSVSSPTWRGMTLRRQLGDPFDLSRRAVGTSTDTLTIRQDRDGATFVLHDRNAGNVAVAGGMLHVMPCGVFQPSSIRPAAQADDFDLWRNIMREYSEEFLGNPEHDGDGPPIDYTAEPFSQFDEGLRQGRVRAFCLGLGLDALTLYGEILTVVVFDGDVYDRIFADLVDHNDEGSLVKTGVVHPTSAIPFTAHTIRELIDSGRMAPAGAGCLQLAWDHRRMLLND